MRKAQRTSPLATVWQRGVSIAHATATSASGPSLWLAEAIAALSRAKNSSLSTLGGRSHVLTVAVGASNVTPPASWIDEWPDVVPWWANP
jgi:hypothetical protein